MRKIVSLFIIVFLVATANSISLKNVTEIDGNSHILSMSLDSAEREIRSYTYDDSGYFYLKLGEISKRRGDVSRARHYFRECTNISSKYAPFAYRRLGDIEVENGLVDYAIMAYRTAADLTTLEPYRFSLFKKIDSLSEANSDELGSVGWVSLWHSRMIGESRPAEIINSWKAVVKEMGLTPNRYDSLKNVATEISRLNLLIKVIYDTTDIVQDFMADEGFAIAKLLSRYGYNKSASDWLHYSLGKDEFDRVVNREDYLSFRTELNFSLKNWNGVIKWGKLYFDEFGYSAPHIYKVARSYRKKGNAAKADYWYEMHLKKFPNVKKSHDILWYRAWQEEDSQNYDSAITLFKDLSIKHRTKKHGDDAAFRVGLLQYRLGKYDDAIKSFKQFEKKFSDSKLFAGAGYWIGRSLLNLEKVDSANIHFKRVIDNSPYNYYAWRSRYHLPEDPFIIPMAEKEDEEKWNRWVDSLSKQITDSLNFTDENELVKLAVQLGSIGFKEEAEYILEPVEIRGEKNYRLLLDLSKFYTEIGLYYHAFKLSKKLYYRMPTKMRKLLPEEYLKMLYPDVYGLAIKKSGAEMGVDGAIVRGIMRQESMFSPTITSYVGARGLMQIMPYTGKEIAKELSEEYDVDELYTDSISIRFGTYYIGKRLKQFDGDKVKAIASYNGGAHNVKKWVKRNPTISDSSALFTEFVGFSETRNYVKRCLENFWIYSRLYDDVNEAIICDEFGVPIVAVKSDDIVDSSVVVD
jgi:TolA-binding protein